MRAENVVQAMPLAAAGGMLYAGGNFTTADGNAANYIARWNGSSLSGLGSRMNNQVNALAMSCNIFITRIDAISPPTLSMIHNGTGAVLSWPTNSTGFVVQSTFSLTPPIIWLDNSNLPVILNGKFTLTNTLSAAAQFFRLKQ